jgi:hypothetical protein
LQVHFHYHNNTQHNTVRVGTKPLHKGSSSLSKRSVRVECLLLSIILMVYNDLTMHN